MKTRIGLLAGVVLFGFSSLWADGPNSPSLNPEETLRNNLGNSAQTASKAFDAWKGVIKKAKNGRYVLQPEEDVAKAIQTFQENFTRYCKGVDDVLAGIESYRKATGRNPELDMARSPSKRLSMETESLNSDREHLLKFLKNNKLSQILVDEGPDDLAAAINRMAETQLSTESLLKTMGWWGSVGAILKDRETREKEGAEKGRFIEKNKSAIDGLRILDQKFGASK